MGTLLESPQNFRLINPYWQMTLDDDWSARN